ncbi:MAG: TerB family tellurite resistance protein [Hydrogenophaga sp.]|jgi:uncharacterized tellurite resistance protein B-like protein|uniref:TerB family tellurite resistance protein n=1 Tax=Hydrogenophaga sp. TaxID=1904254 RepID=UPI00271E9BA3|nr:TerB family tellurite resistance protein [Hydrogenophaga sp.]MDO9505329.1 TerB family tellurite resistance protein [Hydrogenophaga sp.]MDP1781308.1 TerB family tellurite resistance protein [Hydrogenophaga sp.]MDP3627217.1 TerB family tellurite resistance protein [Hydrogenophaga sp.]
MSAPVPFFRSYPHNSPEAAARIVAVALIANGEIKAVEMAALNAHVSHERLGMTEAQWHGVVHDLCADLLRSARSDDESRVSDEMLGHMLREVDDDSTRRAVLKLSCAVVYADGHVEVGESFVLLAMSEHWGLQPDDHALLEPILYGADFQVRLRGVPVSTLQRNRMR